MCVGLLLLLAAAPFAGAAQRWTRLRSEHFVFVGDAPERQIRLVARSLEQFHHVMSQELSTTESGSPRPTVVFVFEADRSFNPYRPRFEGRPIDVVGYFQPGDEIDYVAINAGFGPQALRIVFHEYAHVLARNTTGDLPLWASEGLAGVYETFEARSGGRVATIGAPRADHLALLAGNSFMPLRALLAVERASPVYNEGEGRRLFYAESWALMHYLMLGSQTRAAELRDYFAQMSAGASPERAFVRAFGADVEALERELRGYLRIVRFPDRQLRADGPARGLESLRGEPITKAEVSGYLNDLRDRLDQAEGALTRVKSPVEASPPPGFAAGSPGRLELRERRLDEAPPSSPPPSGPRQFRALGPGEQRALGMFTRVECRPGSAVLVVDAEDQSIRIAASSLSSVRFIAYQDSQPESFGCGPVQPPARVFATYRDADPLSPRDDVDGQVVAIELLPDGDPPL